jgi:hypothetical protein
MKKRAHAQESRTAHSERYRRRNQTLAAVTGLLAAIVISVSPVSASLTGAARAETIAGVSLSTATSPGPRPEIDGVCTVTYADETTQCWQATSPVILAIKVLDKNSDDPQYEVWNADGSKNHTSRLGYEGINRIWLNTGESLALTPPYYNANGGDTKIEIIGLNSQEQGPQPEVGEECTAGARQDIGCFVVSKRSYRLKIKVDRNEFDAPAYEVRRNGVFIHGNRLEMDSDGSTIWVDAGDEFILKGPNVLGSNRIVITEVQEY